LPFAASNSFSSSLIFRSAIVRASAAAEESPNLGDPVVTGAAALGDVVGLLGDVVGALGDVVRGDGELVGADGSGILIDMVEQLSSGVPLVGASSATLVLISGGGRLFFPLMKEKGR